MATDITMKTPICLVENWEEQLKVNPTALDILNQIFQPVVVVAIVGLCRTGKSYLMNRLARQNHGFPIGSTVESETKGIWMWCVPHPSKPNHTLVLLDTEGLGDVEKGDPKNDSWIFALAVLLSSTLVYNSLGTINHQALEQLHFVTELTELIRARSSPSSDEVEDSAEFVSFFPDFVWAVRDFTLELNVKGQPITEDEYLENALKLIPETNARIQNSNKPRKCIRYFFPERKCFVFEWPTNDKNLLVHMDKVPEDKLELNFKVQSEKFCSYIFTHGKTKTLRQGIIVTGNRLGSLVQMYVDTINSGAVPCLENAVTTLAQRENAAAVRKAAELYSRQMAQRLALPTDTLQELLDLHAACEREAIAVFMAHSFKDNNGEFQKNLLETTEQKKEEFLLQNEEASVKYCQAELKRLSEFLMESISRGVFSAPGGHNLYLEARKKVEEEYELVPRKGVKFIAFSGLLNVFPKEIESRDIYTLMFNTATFPTAKIRKRPQYPSVDEATEVLQIFLQSQAATENSILQADKALTDGEKALAAEKAKREAAEKEREVLRQREQEMQQKMEAQERSFQENIAQLKEKMEREKEDLLREQERMLEHKLKAQKDVLTEGFKKEADMLNKEINRLTEEIEAIKNQEQGWYSALLLTAGALFGTVMNRPPNTGILRQLRGTLRKV